MELEVRKKKVESKIIRGKKKRNNVEKCGIERKIGEDKKE